MDATRVAPAAAATEDRGVRAAGDLRFVLRAATDAAHRRLDHGFAGHDLGRRTDYAAFLSAMRDPFAQVEAWLDALWRDEARPAGSGRSALPPDWPARRRRAALRADLSGLGIPARAGAPAPLSPTLEAAEAPGMLYVLEGSRLGGQVLLPQVLASPHPEVRANARFLEHGAGQRLWPSFAAWLGTRPAADHDAAVRGAQRAFALFEAAQAAAPPQAERARPVIAPARKNSGSAQT